LDTDRLAAHYAQIFLVNGKTPPRRGTWGNGGMPAMTAAPMAN
jgi:hypothetical protein